MYSTVLLSQLEFRVGSPKVIILLNRSSDFTKPRIFLPYLTHDVSALSKPTFPGRQNRDIRLPSRSFRIQNAIAGGTQSLKSNRFNHVRNELTASPAVEC